MTDYSMRRMGIIAYELHIFKYSLLGQRDRRLATGGVETRPDEVVVRRLSEFEWGNYFQSQTVLALC